MNSFDILPRSLSRSVDAQPLRDASATAEIVDANGKPVEADSFGSLLDGFAERSFGDKDKSSLADALDRPDPGPDIKAPDALSPDISNSVFVWLDGLLPQPALQTAASAAGGGSSPDEISLPLPSQNLQLPETGDMSASPTPPKIALTVQHQETHFKPIVRDSVSEAFSPPEEPTENISNGLPVKAAAEGPSKKGATDRQIVSKEAWLQNPAVKIPDKQDSAEGQASADEQTVRISAEKTEVQKPAATKVAQDESNSLPPATLQRLADAVSSEIRSAANDSPVSASPNDKFLRTVSIKASDTVLRILNLQLHPADLGTVTIKMKLAGDQLQMELHTEKEETARLLRHDSEKLSMLLRSSGYRPDTISIQVGDVSAQDRMATQTQRQQTDMQFQGQSFQQGGASQEGHPRNRDKQYASTRPELSKDAGEDRALGSRTSGGVYL